jgi:NTP pyrophosphatase (non-canonical NTP hydrolase)
MSAVNSVQMFQDAPRGHKQEAVRRLYAERGYDDTPLVTLPGAMEELGELACALMPFNPYYVSKPRIVPKDFGDPEHELIDTLIYLLALANSLGIDLGI